MTTLKESAIGLAKANFRIFPLRSGTKAKQVLKSWTNEATNEISRIEFWWSQANYNIGLVTGNGVIVIDIDNKGQKNGSMVLEEWEQVNGKLPTTCAVRTPTGGYHLYYFVDREIRNTTELYPGIDVRGDGGYVVVPPSVIDGNQYTWTNKEPMATANELVYKFLEGQKSKTKNSIDELNYNIDKKFVLPKEIEQGARESMLFKYGCSLQAKGISDALIIKAVHEANLERCKPSLGTTEMNQVLSSLNYEKGLDSSNINDFDNLALPKLNPISAKELGEMDIPSLIWVVEEILPIGLGLIGAPPKYFKSFFALGLCLAVATGKDFLGFKTNKAVAIYLDLESSERRPRDRLRLILDGEEMPKDLYLLTANDDVKRLGDGFEEQIKELLEDKKQVKLVVVDVFQLIRSVKSKGGKTAYEADYAELAELKKIALEYEFLLLLVHHNNKTKDNDVFNQLSGSTGLTGAMDVVITITKEDRWKDDAIISITGRDVEGTQLRARFNKKTYQWENLGSLDDFMKSVEQRDYENNPVILTIKEGLMTFGSPWEISAKGLKGISNFLSNVPYIEEDPRSVGITIKKYTDHLYLDDIVVDKKRGKNSYIYIIKHNEHNEHNENLDDLCEDYDI